jgi:hypothetical protein
MPKIQGRSSQAQYKTLLKILLTHFSPSNNLARLSKFEIYGESASRLTLEQPPIEMPADWRFKRTGFTTFFVLDLYMQMILIGAVWMILLILTKCIYRK